MMRKQARVRLLPPIGREIPAPGSVRHLGYALLAAAAVSVLWLLPQLV